MSHRDKSVNSKWHRRAVWLVAFAVFLAGLAHTPVPTVDGAVRASMARNIVVHHQLWPITYEGRIFNDHPPLFLWLTALSYKVFGMTDAAANLVPRLFAFLTVCVTALIAVESGLGEGVALASALILCGTRDFVLSSVRGYIEPLLEFWIYLALYLVLRQKRARALWPAAAAGAAVWLAAYSKGPVALWPLLFFAVLLIWNGPTTRRRVQLANAYVGAFAVCTMLWAVWVTSRGDWPYWKDYLYNQILSSALDGRGGAQGFEPFYFVKILLKFYWPWLPLLVWSIVRVVRRVFELDFSARASYSWIFLLTGLGFIGGFSIVKWKFWYYIAPAYPAFALLIASALYDKLSWLVSRARFARTVALLAAAWIAYVSVVPVRLYRERVPEVMAFKDAITGSAVTGPVWYVRDPMDHNMVGTSGNWYFGRDVIKITQDKEAVWARSKLKAPAWIITGREFWPECREHWCRHATLIQTAGKSALVYYHGR